MSSSSSSGRPATDDHRPRTASRIVAAALGIPVAVYGVWYAGLVLRQGVSAYLYNLWIPFVSLTLAAVLLTFAVGGARAAVRRLLVSALTGGVVLGGVGLLGGIVGPFIVDPRGTHGRLVGLLITGPLGFVVGCVIGALMALTRTGAAHERLATLARKPDPPPKN
jgi:hypothetical protein